jgi:hypothetical protein
VGNEEAAVLLNELKLWFMSAAFQSDIITEVKLCNAPIRNTYSHSSKLLLVSQVLAEEGSAQERTCMA